MDMLEIHKLQIIVDRIMKQTIKDGDCDVWIHSNEKSKRPMASPPRIRNTSRNAKPVRCILFLWQYHYGQPLTHNLIHPCPNGVRCLNVTHKQIFVPKPTKPVVTQPRRTYAKHTPECGGIDPVMVDRIVQAGTIDAMPLEAHICDCERAYILKYVHNGQAIIKTSGYGKQKLLAINV
jgi:hypothetical protein